MASGVGRPVTEFTLSRDTEQVSGPTVELRGARERFTTRAAGRLTQHCFSFNEHYDPANVSHGALLACNDDLLASDAGYPNHPHRDTEIVTWMLSGSLVHQDSHGNRGVIHRGLVQRTSAGSGIVHAERNDAYRVDPQIGPAPAHFVQMWLRPDQAGAPPEYQQRGLELDDLADDWLPVASGAQQQALLRLGSRGSTLWVTQLGPGVARLLPEDDHVHVYLAGGEAEVEGVGPIEAGDSLRLAGRAALKITGRSSAEVLVWAMAS
jgi:redox-sensitive bicupin YhaK (pirin superfamily)